MLGLADWGLGGGTIFLQIVPLSRMRRALGQPHDPCLDLRKSLPVSCSGRGDGFATCWSFVQNNV